MEPVYYSVIGLARVMFAAQGLRFTVTGDEHIPAVGGAVIAINHTAYTDFIYAGLPARTTKRYIRFMAKREVFDHPVTGPIMRALRHIAVDRAEGAESYREAVAALHRGELVGVYPEATISRSFEIKQLRSGAARMAIEADVPIIPMAIWGAQRIWTKGHPKRLGRTHTPISIVVGAPLRPHPTVETLTAELRGELQRLLEHAQADYPNEPGAYWVPARLGGSAPSLAEADRMDATGRGRP